jgi:molybdopterin-containing oxidoreductase family iron-sulfur binding subunit
VRLKNCKIDIDSIEKFVAPQLSFTSLEARILPSVHTGDGSYASNGWLAEAPDPMSKTSWENVILISPKLAAKLDIEPTVGVIQKLGALNRNINQLVDGKLIARYAKLTLDGVSIKGPLFIMPGLADFTIGLQLGFGRKVAGRVATRVAERLQGK